MRRRDLLRLSLAIPATATLTRYSGADSPKAVPLRLTLKTGPSSAAIPPDFIGLSYESAALSDPTFFAPENVQLIEFLRRLGSSGVLRIGGNTSEYSAWSPSNTGANSAPEPIGPDVGDHRPPRRPITPQAIRNLRGFLDVTGWRLIYGLNLGTADPQSVADEATYVAKEMVSKLVAFQVGNEPDLFGRNGLRLPDYNFVQFSAEWRRLFAAIRVRVPDAPFAGPDTAVNNAWLVQFGKEFGSEVRFLSQHYYALGPPSDPSMTIARLLDPQNAPFDLLRDGMRRAHDAAPSVPFRLTETNSCYRGGKPGVSNTFASALWGLDLMYRMAAAGASGINFHGGGYGWYSPIVGTREASFAARPLYYAMLMFAEAGSGQLVATATDRPSSASLFDSHALRNADGQLRLILLNKHPDIDVTLTLTNPPPLPARILRLIAPNLYDAENTTFGASRVDASGVWSPKTNETVSAQTGVATITMPRASAALVTFP